MCFFFFKQKTAYEMRISDWSSDVCSSDLQGRVAEQDALVRQLSYSEKAEPLYAASLILDRAGRTGDAQAVAARIPEGQRTAEMRNFIAGLGSVGAVLYAQGQGARQAGGQVGRTSVRGEVRQSGYDCVVGVSLKK